MGLVVSVVLIKTEFCNEFIVDIADSSCDSMLWLQLKPRDSDLCIFACVCYLPPNGSSRQVDVHDFLIHYKQVYIDFRILELYLSVQILIVDVGQMKII